MYSWVKISSLINKKIGVSFLKNNPIIRNNLKKFLDELKKEHHKKNSQQIYNEVEKVIRNFMRHNPSAFFSLFFHRNNVYNQSQVWSVLELNLSRTFHKSETRLIIENRFRKKKNTLIVDDVSGSRFRKFYTLQSKVLFFKF